MSGLPELFLEDFLQRSRMGFAAGGLHRLTHEKSHSFSRSPAEVCYGRGIFLQNAIDDGFQVGGCGNLPITAIGNDHFRRERAFRERFQDLFCGIGVDFLPFKQSQQGTEADRGNGAFCQALVAFLEQRQDLDGEPLSRKPRL